MKDGRDATTPYRVRVGGVWYWVDPTVRLAAIEPGDTVVIYPAGGAAALAVLQSAPRNEIESEMENEMESETIAFASLDGERFEVAARDIAALHLAAVDDEPSA